MWTENDIPDLTGKTVFITGANSGIGFHKARHLAKNNATVVIGARSLERGNQAKDKILSEFPNSILEVIQLDLNSKASIDGCVTSFKSKYKKLDILLNNAGIMTTPYQPTEDGFESQIGVNHLGHYYLTSKLIDVLKITPGSRIVNTASIAHQFGGIDSSTFVYEQGKKYDKQKAYAQSKLANLLFTNKLAKLVQDKELDITVLASHPGVSSTNLGRHIRGNFFTEIVLWIAGIIRQSGEKGALPGLYASVDPNAVNGSYYGPRGIFHTKGYPTTHKSSKKTHDPVLQDLLWNESEKLLQIKFEL